MHISKRPLSGLFYFESHRQAGLANITKEFKNRKGPMCLLSLCLLPHWRRLCLHRGRRADVGAVHGAAGVEGGSAGRAGLAGRGLPRVVPPPPQASAWVSASQVPCTSALLSPPAGRSLSNSDHTLRSRLHHPQLGSCNHSNFMVNILENIQNKLLDDNKKFAGIKEEDIDLTEEQIKNKIESIVVDENDIDINKLYKKKRVIFMDIKIENDLSRKKMKIRCFFAYNVFSPLPHTPSILFLYPRA